MIFDPHGIIKKIQANMICPVCARHFKASEIQLKQIVENNVIFHAQCNNGHPAIQTINIALINGSVSTSNTAKLSQKNLNLLNKQIDEFDGDFIKLWKK